MIEVKKINVKIYDDRTSATINEHLLELCGYLDGTPDIQDLIDVAIDEYGMSPDGNVSQWISSLIAAAAMKELESLRERAIPD